MFKKILFFAEFSEISRKAFTYALHLAKIHQAKLLILVVTAAPGYPEALLFYLPPESTGKAGSFQKGGGKPGIKHQLSAKDGCFHGLPGFIAGRLTFPDNYTDGRKRIC
jgi:nucleotide-binding universal stress UspA family protein